MNRKRNEDRTVSRFSPVPVTAFSRYGQKGPEEIDLQRERVIHRPREPRQASSIEKLQGLLEIPIAGLACDLDGAPNRLHSDEVRSISEKKAKSDPRSGSNGQAMPETVEPDFEFAPKVHGDGGGIGKEVGALCSGD